MRTVLVSDLHLAAGNDADLLRCAPIRERLLEALRGCERLVLLGDVVELRDRPLASSIELALPFFERLGEAVGDSEVVIVPGNHDHYLVERWLERRRIDGAGPLAAEQWIEPDDWAPAQLAGAMPAAAVRMAYPGLWLADGVYATHGHYLDRHLTIPTLERLGVAMVERVLAIPAGGPDPIAPPEHEDTVDPDEYERVAAPVYALLYTLAQSGGDEPRGAGSPSARLWRMLQGGDSPAAKVRGWLLGSVALPGAVGVANRLGFGPVRPDLSAKTIARAGVEAMGEVLAKLGLEAEHLIFGHTHRRGPLGEEEPWVEEGAKLINTGSWVFTPGLVGEVAASSAYWPGTIAVLDGEGPPRLEHLLDGLSREELDDARPE